MLDTLTVNLDKPVASVGITGNDNTGRIGKEKPNAEDQADAEQISTQDLKAQKVAFSQACGILKGLIDKLNQFYDEVFAKHKGEIAKLSVEIARKILVQKVQNGDYQIESIVKEALENAPTRQDVAVHLNPQDLVQCQRLQQDDPAGTLAGIKFVSDPNIGRAECLLESPKGIIESLIDQHLERIGEALKRAE